MRIFTRDNGGIASVNVYQFLQADFFCYALFLVSPFPCTKPPPFRWLAQYLFNCGRREQLRHFYQTIPEFPCDHTHLCDGSAIQF